MSPMLVSPLYLFIPAPVPIAAPPPAAAPFTGLMCCTEPGDAETDPGAAATPSTEPPSPPSRLASFPIVFFFFKDSKRSNFYVSA